MTLFRWIALWLLAAAAPVHAKGKPLIEPGAAYVLVEIEHLKDALLKGTTAPGTLSLARYDPVRRDVRGGQLSPDTALPKNVSPRVTVMHKPIAKSKESRLYLVRVEPDSWVIEGSGGTAFSLGSRSFAVRAGEIVDLGRFKPSVDWVEGEGPKSMMSGLMGAALFGSMKPKEDRPVKLDWSPRGTGLPLPAALAAATLVPARFDDGATFGNYLGGLVNRMGGRAARPAAATTVEPAPPSAD